MLGLPQWAELTTLHVREISVVLLTVFSGGHTHVHHVSSHCSVEIASAAAATPTMPSMGAETCGTSVWPARVTGIAE